jgi:hypothetical protein
MGQVPGVSAGANYQVRVRAQIGSNASAWSNLCLIKVLPSPLGASTLQASACGKTLSKYQQINAVGVPGANTYTFAFYSDAACIALVDSFSFNRPYLILANDAPSMAAGTYYVKVKASRKYNTTQWAWGTFGAACQLNIADFSTVPNTRLIYAHRNATLALTQRASTVAVTGANSYTFAFYTDENCQNIAGTYTRISNQLLLSSTGLSGTFYVRTKAAIGPLAGAYGIADRLSIGNAASRSVSEERPETAAFSAYPSPSEGMLTIQYDVDDEVWLTVYAGSIEVRNLHFEKGINTALDLSECPNGLLILKAVHANGHTVTQKVVLSR